MPALVVIIDGVQGEHKRQADKEPVSDLDQEGMSRGSERKRKYLKNYVAKNTLAKQFEKFAVEGSTEQMVRGGLLQCADGAEASNNMRSLTARQVSCIDGVVLCSWCMARH